MNKEWQDWTALNLERGCEPQGVRDILLSNGFSESEIKDAFIQTKGADFWRKLKSNVAAKPSVNMNGTQAGVDYVAFSKPKLLDNERLQVIDAEGLQLYVLDDFLSAAECEAVVAQINKDLRPSTITSGTDYGGYRTSSTCDLGQKSAKIIEKVDKKIARTLGVRLPWSEIIQGQKYEVGQEFKEHTDYFQPGTQEFTDFALEMGQRTWTFMVYLNKTEEGGATHFPKIDKTFYPKVGRAVIWNNLKLDGTPNPQSMHHGMPVEKGEKVIITKWFRDKGMGKALL